MWLMTDWCMFMYVHILPWNCYAVCACVYALQRCVWYLPETVTETTMMSTPRNMETTLRSRASLPSLLAPSMSPDCRLFLDWRGEERTQHKTRCIYTPTETQPSRHNLSCYVWHFGHLAYNLIQILNYTFLMSSFSLIVKLSDVLLPVCMTCALVGNLKLLNPYRDSWENLFSNIPGHDLIWQFHSVTEIFISC